MAAIIQTYGGATPGRIKPSSYVSSGLNKTYGGKAGRIKEKEIKVYQSAKIGDYVNTSFGPVDVGNHTIRTTVYENAPASPGFTIGPINDAMEAPAPMTTRFKDYVKSQKAKGDVAASLVDYGYRGLTPADPLFTNTMGNLFMEGAGFIGDVLPGPQRVDIGKKFNERVQSAGRSQHEIQNSYYDYMEGSLFPGGKATTGYDFVFKQTKESPLTQTAMFMGAGYAVGGVAGTVGSGIAGTTQLGAKTASFLGAHPFAIKATSAGLFGAFEGYKGYSMQKAGATNKQIAGSIFYDVPQFAAFGYGFEGGAKTGFLGLKYGKVQADIPPTIEKLTSKGWVTLPKGTVPGRVAFNFDEAVKIPNPEGLLYKGWYANTPTLGAKPLYGAARGLGKRWGTPTINIPSKVLDVGWQPKSNLDAAIFRGTSDFKGLSAAERLKFDVTLSLAKSGYGVEGGNLKQTPYREIDFKYIPEKARKGVWDFIYKHKSQIEPFGSGVQKARTGDLYTRDVHDLDLKYTESANDLAKQMQKIFKDAGVKNVRVNKNLLEVNEGDGWHHALDIHDAAMGAGSSSANEFGYGFGSKPGTNVQGLKSMQLGEQGARKATSILTFGKDGFQPAAHRPGDIRGFYDAQKAITESMKKSVLGLGRYARAPAIASRTANMPTAAKLWGIDTSLPSQTSFAAAPVKASPKPFWAIPSPSPYMAAGGKTASLYAAPKASAAMFGSAPSGRPSKAYKPSLASVFNPPSLYSSGSILSYSKSGYSRSPSSGSRSPPSRGSIYGSGSAFGSSGSISGGSVGSGYGSGYGRGYGYGRGQPSILPALFGPLPAWGGSRGGGSRKKGKKRRYEYTPTLAGIFSGARLPKNAKLPKIFTGAEIRLPR